MEIEQTQLCDFESKIMDDLCHIANDNMTLQCRFRRLISTLELLKQYGYQINRQNYYVVSTAFCMVESLKNKKFQSSRHNNIVKENGQVLETLKEEIEKVPYIKARTMNKEGKEEK